MTGVQTCALPICKVELGPGLLAALRDGYAIDIEALRELLPELDYGRWPTAVAAGLG